MHHPLQSYHYRLSPPKDFIFTRDSPGIRFFFHADVLLTTVLGV